MLSIHDMIGVCKEAQAYDQFIANNRPAHTPVLADLLIAIRADRGLTEPERQQLLLNIQSAIGGNTSLGTPLSSLMSKGLGGILGAIIGKYFGMGIIGQALSAAAGFGLGSMLHNMFNTQPDLYRGYTLK